VPQDKNEEEDIMTIAFPNSARSYDETARRIRLLGDDGMFEIRFFVDIEVPTPAALCRGARVEVS
jgi:hypothetical protein